MSRCTRSGKKYSPLSVLPIPHLSVDVELALRNALQVEDDEEMAAALTDENTTDHQGRILAKPIHASSPRSATSSTCSPLQQDILSVPGSAKEHAKAGKRQRRARKRKVLKAQEDAFTYKLRSSTSKKLQGASIKSGLDSDAVHVARGGWVGLRGDDTAQETPSLAQLKRMGFEVCEWDGRTPSAILDSHQRVVAMLAGRPANDDTWDKMANEVADAMKTAREQGEFDDGVCHHRRGHFPALAVGVSYGGGQRQPGNLVHSKPDQSILETLLDSPAVRRAAGFASSAFAMYAPRLYRYYAETMDSLYHHDPSLRRNFKNSIFPAATFNLGPRTVTRKHTDSGNLAHGWCAIFATGRYNSKRGGHIVLWNIKKVVEFPCGSTILIPSAVIPHSNVPIAPGEERYSLVQYCAGGLMRWVRYGFRTWDSLRRHDPELYATLDAQRSQRSHLALGMFSKVNELGSATYV